MRICAKGFGAMAIEPKSPRKRAVKKSKGKSKVEESTAAQKL